jgi:hypothetical protein
VIGFHEIERQERLWGCTVGRKGRRGERDEIEGKRVKRRTVMSTQGGCRVVRDFGAPQGDVRFNRNR